MPEPMRKHPTPNERERQRIYCERNASGYCLDWCLIYVFIFFGLLWGIVQLIKGKRNESI
jgi:hypothetical protein